VPARVGALCAFIVILNINSSSNGPRPAANSPFRNVVLIVDAPFRVMKMYPRDALVVDIISLDRIRNPPVGMVNPTPLPHRLNT